MHFRQIIQMITEAEATCLRPCVIQQKMHTFQLCWINITFDQTELCQRDGNQCLMSTAELCSWLQCEPEPHQPLYWHVQVSLLKTLIHTSWSHWQGNPAKRFSWVSVTLFHWWLSYVMRPHPHSQHQLLACCTLRLSNLSGGFQRGALKPTERTSRSTLAQSPA